MSKSQKRILFSIGGTLIVFTILNSTNIKMQDNKINEQQKQIEVLELGVAVLVDIELKQGEK